MGVVIFSLLLASWLLLSPRWETRPFRIIWSQPVKTSSGYINQTEKDENICGPSGKAEAADLGSDAGQDPGSKMQRWFLPPGCRSLFPIFMSNSKEKNLIA